MFYTYIYPIRDSFQSGLCNICSYFFGSCRINICYDHVGALFCHPPANSFTDIISAASHNGYLPH